MPHDARILLAGTVLAWVAAIAAISFLGAAVGATLAAVSVLAATVLLVGPEGVTARVQYGVAAGVVVVLSGVVVPAAIRNWDRLEAGLRVVASVLAAVVVLAVGLALLRIALPGVVDVGE
jgi:hypothetical protein